MVGKWMVTLRAEGTLEAGDQIRLFLKVLATIFFTNKILGYFLGFLEKCPF